MRRAAKTSGTITALRVQKRRPDRVTVYLDGVFAFGLAAVQATRLRVGQALSEQEVEALGARDAVEQAHDRALRFLTLRPRSMREVRDNLSRAGTPVEAIDAELQRLSQAGLVDDVEFARFWVRNREAFRPKSRLALKMELRDKGLDDATIAAALEDVDEEAGARSAALAQVRRIRAGDEKELRMKLVQFLMRRGFAYCVADAAARQAIAESGARDRENLESEESEWEERYR